MNKMLLCGAAMAAVLFSAGAGEILKSWNFADPEEQKLVEAHQAAAANPSRYAEADVFARVRERIQAYVEKD